jgi:hypothetical protein
MPRTLDYSEEALRADGIPYYRNGTIPARLTRARERAQFEAKWRDLNLREDDEGEKWYIGDRVIVPTNVKMELIREWYRNGEIGLTSPLSIYRKIRIAIVNISRSDVETAVMSMPTHQIHRRIEKATISKPVVSKREGQFWQIDFKQVLHTRLPYEPVRAEYFLVMVDTHSKYACARVTRSRDTAILIQKVDEMLNELPVPVRKIQGDQEFSGNREFKAFLRRRHNIDLIKIPPHTPTSNGLVERTIGTLTSHLFRLRRERGGNWILDNHLGQVVANYNQTFHSATGLPPHVALHRPTDETRAAVVANRRAALDRTMKRERRKFKVIEAGDRVRISLIREDPNVRREAKAGQRKGHSERGNWTEETFIVERVNKTNMHAVFPTYKLVGRRGVYKREHLQRIELYPDDYVLRRVRLAQK